VIVGIDDGDRRLSPNPTSNFVIFASFRVEGERERGEVVLAYL
jgi:hypothetical protein